MKKILLLLLMTTTLSSFAFAEENKIDFGFHMDAGARYDDLRMCVASDAGVKGGVMADIYFDLNFNLDENSLISVSIPVMRPLLFGIAFQVLQLEPLVNYYYFFGDSDKIVRFVLGGGAGISFHWGPDYNSDFNNRGSDFFAMGPIINIYGGFTIANWQIGIRGFYEPLFTESNGVGTVLGAALVVGASW